MRRSRACSRWSTRNVPSSAGEVSHRSSFAKHNAETPVRTSGPQQVVVLRAGSAQKCMLGCTTVSMAFPMEDAVPHAKSTEAVTHGRQPVRSVKQPPKLALSLRSVSRMGLMLPLAMPKTAWIGAAWRAARAFGGRHMSRFDRHKRDSHESVKLPSSAGIGDDGSYLWRTNRVPLGSEQTRSLATSRAHGQHDGAVERATRARTKIGQMAGVSTEPRVTGDDEQEQGKRQRRRAKGAQAARHCGWPTRPQRRRR